MTTPTSGPNLYDVLDVDPGADSDRIRDAWRAATVDLTPADRRFRLYSQAAEVLLDPERRAAYDAELATAAEGESPPPESAPAAEPAPAQPEPEPAPAPREASGSRSVPTWLLAGLAVLTVLSLALTGHLLTQPSEGSVEDAAASARSAAERAIVPVLSYDHRTLDEDQQAAHDWLTADQEQDYDELFEVIRDNAPSTRTVVDVEVISSAIVRAGEDRSEILLFVNRPTTNKATQEPVVYKDQVRVRLERVEDEWLVDCMITTPEGRCGS